MRIRHFFVGWILSVGALTLCMPLFSLLFVLSQFSGNASFPIECAIVFGSAVHGGSEAGPGIRRRTEAAAALYEEGKVQTLIVSGGIGEGNRLSEAEVMQKEALELGVEAEDIRIEKEATSTWENIKFVQPLAENCSSIVAVSDRYHLARIRVAAVRQNLDIQVYPAAPPENPLFEFREVLRESIAVLVYLVVRFP